jgi:uncharacterized protein YeaO (DUF488 family)
MRNAVFDPAIFFISQTDWFDAHKRDRFLKHLYDNLTNIDQYSVAQIVWNDELESCLWAHPRIPPWRQDRDWNIRLVPIIYRIFQRHRTTVNCGSSQIACTVAPLMNCVNADALTCFLKLMHKVGTSIPDILLCLGLENILSTNSSYAFSCTCCFQNLIPKLINSSIDWLHYIDLEEEYWPNDISDSDKFAEALKIVRIRAFNSSPFLYEFEFSPRFVNELIATQSNKMEILHQIVKRLILTSQQASRDESLQDEYLRKKGEYRFRVTPRPSSARIHYKYDTSGAIIFSCYYGAGHHDDGL